MHTETICEEKKMQNPGCPTWKVFYYYKCVLSIFLMPRNLFLKVLWNFNFSFLWIGRFWSNLTRWRFYVFFFFFFFFFFCRFSSITCSEKYIMKDYHNFDLPREFEHSSLVRLTAIPVLCCISRSNWNVHSQKCVDLSAFELHYIKMGHTGTVQKMKCWNFLTESMVSFILWLVTL